MCNIQPLFREALPPFVGRAIASKPMRRFTASIRIGRQHDYLSVLAESSADALQRVLNIYFDELGDEAVHIDVRPFVDAKAA